MNRISNQKGINLIRRLFLNAETIYMYDVEPIKANIKKPAVKKLPQLPQLPQILQSYPDLTEEEIDAFEERAAIIEFCGGKSRMLAEYLAIRCLKF